MAHAFSSGCPCCLPRNGLSRRQFLCTTAAGVAAAPALASGVIGAAEAAPRAQAGRPIPIKGGCVLSLDSAVGDFEQADVLVEGKKITVVRPNISAPNAQLIDASKCIVMPGFVDTHRHMWEGFLRNSLPDGSLLDYIALIQKKFGANFVPEDVYIANLLSTLGCIDVGVTTVLDWSHIQNSPEHTDAAIKGLQESGVRSVFAYGYPQTASGNWRDAPKNQFPGDIGRLRKQYFNSDDQLTTLFLASPGGAPADVVQIWKAARDVGARITIHVGVGEFGRSAFLEKVHGIDPLKSDTTYVHCCTLNDTEWKLIKDSGGTVSLASYVEKLMGHGNPPVQKAIDMGIRPSLSVDVETSVPNDFFNQMRSVFSQQKNEVWERKLSGDKNPPKFLTVREALEFATIEGARANGLDKKVGSLTPGKEADIIILDATSINVAPLNQVPGAVVSLMDRTNVETVIVAGKVR
ncbi:MAG: amidohydrolase family protein, partial [Croceibacterium sp.]